MSDESITREKVAFDYNANLAPITLSDGSVSYNVILDADGITVCFACDSKSHATDLIMAIHKCSWIERAA